MNMKRTALASAIALTLVGSPAWATTSTVAGQFILDKTEVVAGKSVNLALLGLDKSGAVDRFGESSGAVIMAIVNSVQGEVIGGSASPGESYNATNPLTGTFTSSVKYVRLSQGNGEVAIAYPIDAAGTDTVTVTLQERFANSSGGVEFKTIATATKSITIKPASANPIRLWIDSFQSAPADPRGASDANPTDGISGVVTAGVAGGQITVKAQNVDASGNVTVTLTAKNSLADKATWKDPAVPEKQMYVYTGRMINGQAIITLDSKVTKTTAISDDYYVKAEMEGFTGNSVGLEYPDIVTVYSTGTPRKVALKSEKERITLPAANTPVGSQPFQGTKVVAVLLDEFGNVTTNNTQPASDIKLSVTDANQVVSNSALVLKVPAGSMTGTSVAVSNDDMLGNAAGELIKVGTSSLVATAVDGNGIPIATIAAAEPLAIKIVSDSLAVVPTAVFSGSMVNGVPGVLAGTEFDAFTVTVSDNVATPKASDPGAITIKNMASGEELTVNRKTDGSNIVQALFKKATPGDWYLLSDKQGNLAQVKVQVTGVGVKTAAATVVELRDAHGGKKTGLTAAGPSTAKQFQVKVPELAFKMFDGFGNPVTANPITENVTGQFTLVSSNGTVSYTTPETNRGVPGRDLATTETNFVNGSTVPAKTSAKVTYDGTGAKKFTGDDSVAASFTKPGLGTNQLTITTTVPKLKELTTIKSYIEQNSIPVNSQVALTVEVLDQDGLIFRDPDPTKSTVITVKFNGATTDTVIPKVWEVGGAAIASGQALNFTSSNGRKVFVVDAGASVGQFTLTFADATGAIKEVRTFKVTQNLVADCSPTNLGLCTTVDACAGAGGVYAEVATTSATGKACRTAPALGAPDATGKPAKGGWSVNAKGEYVFVGYELVEVSGGTSVEDGEFSADNTMIVGQRIVFAGRMKVHKDHIGKKAKLIAVGAVDFDNAGDRHPDCKGTCWYWVKESATPVPNYWSQDMTLLGSFRADVTLTESFSAQWFKGPFGFSGKISGYFGYQLEDGTVIFNPTALKLTIKIK